MGKFPKRFTVVFPESVHAVEVRVHRDLRALRRTARKKGYKGPRPDAFCWLPWESLSDGCVAEMHLAAAALTFNIVAHESSHAAHHRGALRGGLRESVAFDEELATDTGWLTDAVLAGLAKLGVKVACEFKMQN